MILSRDYTDIYQNSADLRRSILVTSIVTPALATLFVGLRLYSARVFSRRIEKHDWLILIALIFSILYSISTGFQLKYELGLHKWELANGRVQGGYFVVSFFPIAITNNFSILFTKASILAFYLRFSVSKRFKIAVYFVLSIVIAYNLMGAFAFLYACQPMIRTWVPTTPGTCINANAWFGTLVALNVLTDLVLLLLPIWLIKPLRVGFAQKAAIVAILGTGSFVLGISVFRLYLTVDSFSDMDFLHRYGVNYLWLIVEVNVAIICACLPCLRTLAGRYMPALMVTPKATPPRLKTIPITHRTRETRTTGATVEHIEVALHKPDNNKTMWLESRASSVFLCLEPERCEMGSDRADSPSVYSSVYSTLTTPTSPTRPETPMKPHQLYFREGFV
ncbi:hypothetical protein B0T16DRAFT_340664 [Cercophora newfieldiana]|uniref:Rhodopsin domain-containing protein n=1 Tax=Cercophora newfieldiana TaxID=92897 RepID=A0AA39YT86_9PEZI|nr:hypothetical protein B0T16DRAFT_340664 [Cercophora newfieldiana]